MGGLFSSPPKYNPPPPAPTPAPAPVAKPEPINPTIAAATPEKEEIGITKSESDVLRKKRKQGRYGTLLTSGEGLLGSAEIKQKSLLGD